MVVEGKDILSFLPCSNSIFYFLFANHRCPHIDAVRDQYRSCAIVIAEVTTLSIGDLISNETCVLGVRLFGILSNDLPWCVLQNCWCFPWHTLLIVSM